MQNIRPVSEKKWDISNHAFYQAYHFAMRYKEFKDILRYKTNTVGSPKFGDTTGSGVTKSATEELAIKRAWAKKADQQLYKYILKAVTEEGITYKYLKTVMNIPAGRNYFYEKRRKFYYILSKKLDN